VEISGDGFTQTREHRRKNLQLLPAAYTPLFTVPFPARSYPMARKTAAQAQEEQIKDQAFSELQALIEESEKLLKSSAALVGEEAETLRGQIALKLQQARDSVTSVRERTQPVVDATETYIGGHPWQTVAISAGFGLVVGLLLGRR
jgi:ElaB/YqjD/DUF883 family membrane-anchored ribosome-binding protein